MGFFSDLKEDLSQAVTELMPDNNGNVQQDAEKEEAKLNEAAWQDEEKIPETANNFQSDLNTMLSHITESEDKNDSENEAEAVKEEVYVAQAAPAKVPAEQTAAERPVSDEVSVIMDSTIINGNIATEGSLDIRGSIVGDVEALGKLNITGAIQGIARAQDVVTDGAKITGEIHSNGAVMVGQNSIIIGNVYATSCVVAGAIKGDLDVKGPVLLDASAIVKGNIRSKSVQINNGAVVEGMCSQCYADVNPTSFFDDLEAK